MGFWFILAAREVLVITESDMGSANCLFIFKHITNQFSSGIDTDPQSYVFIEKIKKKWGQIGKVIKPVAADKLTQQNCWLNKVVVLKKDRDFNLITCRMNR